MVKLRRLAGGLNRGFQATIGALSALITGAQIRTQRPCPDPNPRSLSVSEYAEWSDRIYFCPECDEADHDDYTQCPRYPTEHDESAIMGTGTSDPPDIQAKARELYELDEAE